MAKVKSASTRTAFGFVPGDVATKTDFIAVHEQQNASRGDTIHNLLAIQPGGQGWGGGSELSPAGLGVNFPATGTTTDVYLTSIYVDSDLTQLAIRTVATLAAATTASLVVTVGASSSTHAHTAGATTTINSTLNTSATGTGWLLVTVDLQRDTGDPSSGTFDRMRIRSNAIPAASLGDPV